MDHYDSNDERGHHGAVQDEKDETAVDAGEDFGWLKLPTGATDCAAESGLTGLVPSLDGQAACPHVSKRAPKP